MLLGIREQSSDEKSLSNLIEKIRGLMSELKLPVVLKMPAFPTVILKKTLILSWIRRRQIQPFILAGLI